MRTRKIVTSALMFLLGSLPAAACSTSTGTGAAIGGIGAGLLTGSVGTAALGAAVGAGVGYLSEQEKAEKQAQLAREQEALEDSRVTGNSSTAYRPENNNPFTGSTWRVITIEGEGEHEPFTQIVVSFQTNNKVTTMISRPNGESEAYVETYGIVDDVIVFQGKEDGKEYSVAAKYSRNNNLMTVTFVDVRVVLEEVEESV